MKQTFFSSSMKVTLIGITALTVVYGLWTASPAEAGVQRGRAQSQPRYRIDLKQSTVMWHGYYLFSFGEHYGAIDLKPTELSFGNDELRGTFEIDMNTLRTIDMKDEEDGGKGFNDHLKSDDFFSVAKFPTAMFTITKTEKIKDATTGQPNYEVTGNLTLKGITKSLKFPVEVSAIGKTLTARGRFKFDRTLWNIQYKSGKVFGDVGDSAISDAIGIEFNLKGNAL
jgi:polyisoprenoid-binding protein YceI